MHILKSVIIARKKWAQAEVGEVCLPEGLAF